MLVVYYEKIEDIFYLIPSMEYIEELAVIGGHRMGPLIRHLECQYKLHTPFAPIPSWVGDYGSDISTVSRIKEFIEGVSDEELKVFTKSLSVNEDEIMDIRMSLDVFRAHGPVNAR